MTTQAEKFNAFVALHERPGAFVMPNPWDAGSSRILSALGFRALATTSAGFAFSLGLRDSTASLSREQILENARAIVDATHLPVSADLENGFGPAPEDCVLTIRAAAQTGLAGGSIEDATGDAADPIYGFAQSVERVAAASEEARRHPFVLTARAENFIRGRPDLEDTIRRLQAYEAAGAHVLYAPGLPTLDAIATVCSAVRLPVNVVMGLSGPVFSVKELAAAGVKRISVGGSLARAALGGFVRAAREIKECGTFGYASEAISHTDASEFMVTAKR